MAVPEASHVPASDGPLASHIVRAHRNELPVGPNPDVLGVLRHVVPRLNRYPDPAYQSLIHALVEELQVNSDQLAIGAGSSSVLQRLIRIRCRADSEVVFTGPTFDMLDGFAAQVGARVLKVRTGHDGHVDLESLARAANREGARVVVVANPHNPTGTLAHSLQLRSFIERVPSRVLIVLDEAYRGFSDDPATPDGVELAKAYWASGRDNLVVARSFSKAFGLAGARVGYAVAPPEIAAALVSGGLPVEVSAMSQALAVAALHQRRARQRDINDVIDERARVRKALRRSGLVIPRSQANFLWLPIGRDSRELALWCGERGLQVQSFPQHGVRVTIGTKSDNDRLIRIVESWFNRPVPA